MDNILVVYFTGTGSSKLVADAIEKKLVEKKYGLNHIA